MIPPSTDSAPNDVVASRLAIEQISEVGRCIEGRWRDLNFDEHAFHGIATSVLEDMRLPERVSPWNLVKWTLEQSMLPEQQDLGARFGDPPITLWTSSRFHIDVYFWLNGTTSIHQHGFSGAFQVLLGGSVHCAYTFERSEAINRCVELGELSLRHVELLRIGDVRPIAPGRDFIHALFHLEQPSATIVVRTHHALLSPPQFDYRKPWLAVDPFFTEPRLTKQLQALVLLYRAGRPDADDAVAAFLATADFQSTFSILSSVRGYLRPSALQLQMGIDRSQERLNRFLATVRQRHGQLADVLPPVFSHQDAISDILARRAHVTDPELRFFLALLLNVNGRDRILDLVRARYPGADPVQRVLDWVSDLGHLRLAASPLPNALGVERFSDADSALLERLLTGVECGEGERARTELLRGNVLLRPLFS